MMDAWISLTDVVSDGERNRVLYVLKSRGMRHSNQLREYRLTNHGVELIEPYIGPEGVLTGTARLSQEAREREHRAARAQDVERHRREFARKQAAAQRQIAEIRSALEAEEKEMAMLLSEDEGREVNRGLDRAVMAKRRGISDD